MVKLDYMYMNIKNESKLIWIIFALIIVLAIFLRFYKLDQVPPSLSWDEVAVGYNAFTIANWGKDEWGKTLPFYFKSFEDDKSPVHIYLTAISVKILGLNQFSTRVPFALFGIFNVILIFFLAKILFKSEIMGLTSAFFMAISPYAIQFSRFNHEANIALFFFMLGLFCFYKCLNQFNSNSQLSLNGLNLKFKKKLGIEKKPRYIIFSFLSFGISILSYHSSKIIVPVIMILLCGLYYKNLLLIKKELFLGILVLIILGIIFIFNPALLGNSRMKQTTIEGKPSEKLEIIWNRYLTHFTTDYLFISGDKNPKFSTQIIGEFYKIELIFLIIGTVGLIIKRSKVSVVILVWALLAPIPASVFGGKDEAPHAARSLFTMGSWNIVSAYGFYLILKSVRKPSLQILIVAIALSLLFWQFKDYINYYFNDYPRKNAIDWQYGMKQSVDYIKQNNGYFRVYVTDIRSQPYIFFLYYLKEPLPKFLETVNYNQTESRSHSLVDNFSDFYFGGDLKEGYPNPGYLYILTPSEYDGLRYKNVFNIKKKILYPNGTDAFFLVSYP